MPIAINRGDNVPTLHVTVGIPAAVETNIDSLTAAASGQAAADNRALAIRTSADISTTVETNIETAKAAAPTAAVQGDQTSAVHTSAVPTSVDFTIERP